MRVLVMGLPGSGKTTLADEITNILEQHGKVVLRLNADSIRTIFNDWDFSEEGRIRQANRMLSLSSNTEDDFVIVDFVAPLPKMRDIFAADFTVWVNTIAHSAYEDTNSIFVNPMFADVEVTEQNAEKWANIIVSQLLVESQEA